MYKSLKTKIKSRQFAVIRHRYSLLEILTRRVHNVIAAAMSISVAFSNKVMDTRRPQPVGCGGKYDVYGFGLKYLLCAFCNATKYPSPAGGEVLNNALHKGLDVVRQYAALLERGVQNSTRVRKAPVETRQANPLGRSMIEMLGVLAIIAVLSVGGIAGYSKAMEKFKINKMIDEYTYLINGLLEYKDNLIKSNPAEGSIKLYDFILAANLVPPSWTTENTWAMTDTIGNTVVPYLNNQDQFLVLDVHLRTTGKGTADFAYNSCVTLFKDIAKPLSQNFVGIFAGSSATSVHYDGSLYCHNGKDNTKCLSDMTLPEIDEACKKCLAGKSSCMVTMVW